MHQCALHTDALIARFSSHCVTLLKQRAILTLLHLLLVPHSSSWGWQAELQSHSLCHSLCIKTTSKHPYSEVSAQKTQRYNNCIHWPCISKTNTSDAWWVAWLHWNNNHYARLCTTRNTFSTLSDVKWKMTLKNKSHRILTYSPVFFIKRGKQTFFMLSQMV